MTTKDGTKARKSKKQKTETFAPGTVVIATGPRDEDEELTGVVLGETPANILIKSVSDSGGGRWIRISIPRATWVILELGITELELIVASSCNDLCIPKLIAKITDQGSLRSIFDENRSKDKPNGLAALENLTQEAILEMIFDYSDDGYDQLIEVALPLLDHLEVIDEDRAVALATMLFRSHACFERLLTHIQTTQGLVKAICQPSSDSEDESGYTNCKEAAMTRLLTAQPPPSEAELRNIVAATSIRKMFRSGLYKLLSKPMLLDMLLSGPVIENDRNNAKDWLHPLLAELEDDKPSMIRLAREAQNYEVHQGARARIGDPGIAGPIRYKGSAATSEA